MGWWSQVKSVFAQAEKSSRNEPILHEPLTRHRERAEELAVWCQGIICQAITDWLSQAYGEFLIDGQPRDESIDFLDTPSSKGFVIHFHRLQYSLFEAEMFQLYLRERVLAKAESSDSKSTRDTVTAPERSLNQPAMENIPLSKSSAFSELVKGPQLRASTYRTQVADSKTYSKAGHTERTDRYYLKPRPVFHDDPAIAAAPNTYTSDQFGQGYGNIMIELIVRDEQPHLLRFSATIYHDRVYQKATSFSALMQRVLKG